MLWCSMSWPTIGRASSPPSAARYRAGGKYRRLFPDRPGRLLRQILIVSFPGPLAPEKPDLSRAKGRSAGRPAAGGGASVSRVRRAGGPRRKRAVRHHRSGQGQAGHHSSLQPAPSRKGYQHPGPLLGLQGRGLRADRSRIGNPQAVKEIAAVPADRSGQGAEENSASPAARERVRRDQPASPAGGPPLMLRIEEILSTIQMLHAASAWDVARRCHAGPERQCLRGPDIEGVCRKLRGVHPPQRLGARCAGVRPRRREVRHSRDRQSAWRSRRPRTCWPGTGRTPHCAGADARRSRRRNAASTWWAALPPWSTRASAAATRWSWRACRGSCPPRSESAPPSTSPATGRASTWTPSAGWAKSSWRSPRDRPQRALAAPRSWSSRISPRTTRSWPAHATARARPTPPSTSASRGPGVVDGALRRRHPTSAGGSPWAISPRRSRSPAFRVTRVGELIGREVAAGLGVPFGIVDLSLAPTPEVGDSVGEILRTTGIEKIGTPGSTAAVAMLTDAVKKGGAFASTPSAG